MLKSVIAAAGALLALSACASPQVSEPVDVSPPPPATPPPPAKIGAFGLDLTGRDPSVKPGDDFYRYAVGHWLATNQIPADRTVWGTFSELDAESEKRVKGLVESLPQNAPAGSTEQKVSDFFNAYNDTDAIERAGLEPARESLRAIDAARTHEDIATLMGRPDMPVPSPLGFGITIDEKNPDRYAVIITQAGLGLPERDYYLKDDVTFKEIRQKYAAHISRLLILAGEKNTDEKARQVLALETRIARDHWPIAKRRERELTYNLKSRAELDKLAPGYPWKAQLTAGGIDAQPQFVVAELDAVEKLGKKFRATPVAQWRTYLKYHYLKNVSGVLPKAFDDETFGFFGRTLNGQQQQRDRWKRGVDAVDGALGEAVGQIYVARYFPPDSKAKMLELVENLRKAYSQRVQQLSWMTEDTKKAALEKLATFRPKIGYPDKWRDYSKLEVRAGDAFGNATRSAVFNWHRDADRLDQPTDRDEWGMTPYTVNAYYNPTFNEIVFPAAILEPPFFDPNADPAVNYGAIGGVIGHEMGHGFDDQGAKSDARGVLRTWWQPADEKSFKVLGDNLVAQYDGYEALPGLKVNGRLTLGENIGDLGGMTVALEAYRLSLKGQQAPVLDGLTGDEPLVNLDYKLREDLRNELRNLFAGGRTTVVYATTEPQEALQLGDETVVLDAGRLVQHGNTLEIFRRPATLAAARAFSDPPLNELRAQVDLNAGVAVVRNDLRLPLAAPALTVLRNHSPEIILGIRAHQFTITPETGAASISGRIDLAEISGSDTYVHVSHGDLSLVAQLPGVHELTIGEQLTLYVEPSHVYCFDTNGNLIFAPH